MTIEFIRVFDSTLHKIKFINKRNIISISLIHGIGPNSTYVSIDYLGSNQLSEAKTIEGIYSTHENLYEAQTALQELMAALGVIRGEFDKHFSQRHHISGDHIAHFHCDKKE